MGDEPPLPLAFFDPDGAAMTIAAGSGSTTPAGTGDSVLVVEDDHDLREMMEQMLHLEGFATFTAGNGLEALDVLRAGARVRVILLDLMMPVMDGWEFRRHQQADPHMAGIPVVVMSALNGDRLREIDPLASFRKPLPFDHMIALLQRLCGR
jgi:CheY-like chemotaxis protein